MNKLTTIGLLLLAVGSAVADDLTIPNTFQSNTPARAADVNANFTAVEASVDDNAADIAANSSDIQANSSDIAALNATGAGIRLYSADGATVGRFITATGSTMWLLSDTGYVFGADGSDSGGIGYLTQQAVGFSGMNCTGDAYTTSLGSAGASWMWQGIAIVFRAPSLDDSGPVYYWPADSVRIPNVSMQSQIADPNTGCENVAGFGGRFMLLPNDEALTGVSNTRPTLPFSLGPS